VVMGEKFICWLSLGDLGASVVVRLPSYML
jgi:hypothetical protein